MTRAPHTLDEAMSKLSALENKDALAGKKYFGINIDKALGLTMPQIRGIAKTITKDHDLALGLWQTDIHDARLLASMVDHPGWVTEDQMNEWAKGFDSWDIVDQTVGDLFDRTPFADAKVFAWAAREEEFVRRAAFSMIAYMAVHDKKRDDMDFLKYLPLIESHSTDERNFVKKAVNWALRQIGKRSAVLHPHALRLAENLAAADDKTAKWIGADAARELKGEKILKRLGLG